MKAVTDPQLLAELNGQPTAGLKPVTDASLLSELNGDQQRPSSLADRIKAGFKSDLQEEGDPLSRFFMNVGKGFGGSIGNALNRANEYVSGKLGVHPGLDTSQFSEGEGVGGFTGRMLPYVLGGEAAALGKAPSFVEGMASQLSSPTIAKALNYAGMVGKNAAFGGAANAAEGGDVGQGALIGGAVGGALPIAEKLINAFRPTKALAGGAPPEELQRNLEVTEGTRTPIGDVVGSPGAKRFYENFLTKLPLSGANKNLQAVYQNIKDKSSEFLSKLLGNNDAADVGRTLQQALRDRLKEVQELKRANYAKPNEIAESIGLKVGRENFSNAAKDALEELNQSPELMEEVSSGLISKLQKYANGENSNTLKLSNIFKGKIGDKASESYLSGNNHEYGIYRSLKDALDKDIQSAIESSSSPEIKSAHDAAQKFYRDEIVPFEQPEVAKFAKGIGDPDTLLSTFIKSGKNDRGNLVDKLVSKLPQDKQHLAAYGWLSRAVDNGGEINPAKLATIMRDLGDKQKSALFPNAELRKQAEDLTSLIGKNSKAISLMHNPPTGQQANDLLPFLLTHGLGGLGGLGGTYVGEHNGGLTGGLTGLVLGTLAPGAILNPVQRALTNQTIRNHLVKKIIEQSQRGAARSNLTPALLMGSAMQSGGQ